MTAGNYQLEIEQRADFEQPFVYKDSNDVAIPLTNFTAKMQIRQSAQSPDPALALFTTANGKLVIDAPAGKVTIKLNSADTSGFTFDSGKWDLILISPTGVVTRLAEGDVIIIRGVTKPDA